MMIGKFLVPEFCNEIGMTLEDLFKLKPLCEKLDDKHKYEEDDKNSVKNACASGTIVNWF